MKRLVILGLLATTAPAAAQQASADHRLAVVSESGDIVTWIRPGAGTLTVDRVVPVGIMPADIDGPHNVTMAPDGRSYYVTIAHGVPFGSLWRLDAANDTILGRAQVELFPTTIALSPDGDLAFVANSDFHGDRPRTNVVSIVHTPAMQKITDVPVCDMPHGVKVNHGGTRLFISCMHSDEIVEMDVSTFGITRRVRTGSGHETAVAGPPGADPHAQHTGAAAAGAVPAKGADASAEGQPVCAPTFVSVSPDDRRLYVACNTGNTLQVYDAVSLTRLAEIPVGRGAYNVEPSPDGRVVVVTNKKDQSVSVVDAASLKEVARIPTSKKIVHGVAFSPDSRFAYISSESIGADPGAVDMIDLAARKVVASLPVPAQPTGITMVRR
jgi:YVTN family beta-propeller protein